MWWVVLIGTEVAHSECGGLLTVDNVNFYYYFKPEGEHEYTLV